MPRALDEFPVSVQAGTALCTTLAVSIPETGWSEKHASAPLSPSSALLSPYSCDVGSWLHSAHSSAEGLQSTPVG